MIMVSFTAKNEVDEDVGKYPSLKSSTRIPLMTVCKRKELHHMGNRLHEGGSGCCDAKDPPVARHNRRLWKGRKAADVGSSMVLRVGSITRPCQCCTIATHRDLLAGDASKKVSGRSVKYTGRRYHPGSSILYTLNGWNLRGRNHDIFTSMGESGAEEDRQAPGELMQVPKPAVRRWAAESIEECLSDGRKALLKKRFCLLGEATSAADEADDGNPLVAPHVKKHPSIITTSRRDGAALPPLTLLNIRRKSVVILEMNERLQCRSDLLEGSTFPWRDNLSSLASSNDDDKALARYGSWVEMHDGNVWERTKNYGLFQRRAGDRNREIDPPLWCHACLHDGDASQSRIYAQESYKKEKTVINVEGVEQPTPFHVHYGDPSIARPRATFLCPRSAAGDEYAEGDAWE
ncbi:hypothetical protein IW262DRAFT_1300934 [Armillaria fumosa]|nr:hypothetical protein IW262DRAFT_1300934 [Armillaria fumosa]